MRYLQLCDGNGSQPCEDRLLRAALLLRRLWPRNEFGYRIPVEQWAKEIGISKPKLLAFLAGADQGIRIGPILQWIRDNHGPEMMDNWMYARAGRSPILRVVP